MAIEKKLICFARLEEFERQLAAGNILDYSIVFIQDAKKIWNRGTYYDCSGSSDAAVYGDGYIESEAHDDGIYLKTNVADNLDAVSARGQLADALDVKTFVADAIPSNVSELNNDSSYTPYDQVVSMLSSYVKKETGKGLSAQDFTTELEGKLKGIEANAQKNVQPDWNESDTDSDAYVNNRTHYSYDIEQVTSFSIASKNQGDILVTGLLDGVFYRIINNAGGKNEAFHFVEGRKVVIPSNGPTIEAVCAYEDDFCLKLTTPTYGMTESFVLKEVYVEQLGDVYIPETIARKAEIATINGQSLTEGGDITIEGGGSYDDSEIREAISQLSAITDDFNSDIANLYNVKQDTLESGTNIKTINGESILGSGNISIEGGESSQPMVSTTWAELKEMRDSASLVAGTWYRITDYVTTTSQLGTRSLEHPFDVIVLATGADTLSEEARAARHEGDVSVSVSLMGMSFFYKGVLTVDGVEWLEFENPEAGSIVSSSATPAIGDIVYPYYDGMVATEEAYPIESVSEGENEYFLNNNANLDAWKIWYCLDNDKVRFPWAVAKTKKSIVVQMDEATSLTAEYNGTYEYEGIMYYRWDVFYAGMNVLILTVSDNPKVGDTTSVYGVIEMNMFLPYPMPIVSVNEPSENEGLGVIYRMIDEQSNDIPYDFKNIQFVRKVTLGKLDLENGADEFVFTFNSFDENTGISSDYSFNRLLCVGNNIKISQTGLNDIVFLNESTSFVGCNSNTFGYNCYSNTFGDGCNSNTFGDGCYSNTFGYSCDSNTFEYNCYSNTFGYSCYSNTFGYGCCSNTFGDSCNSNTFGYSCYSNTFGDICYSNTFGYSCYSNTFGYGCYSNTFGYSCYSNTFGESSDALVSNVRYYTLANNIYGKFLSVEGNRSYETKVAYNSIGELKMYCEADLAN